MENTKSRMTISIQETNGNVKCPKGNEQRKLENLTEL